MRIAYIINSVEGGGAAFPVPAICSVLRDNGAEVRVLALSRRDGRAAQPILSAGFELRVRDGVPGDHFAAFRWLSAEIGAYRPTHLWTSLTRATLLGQLVGLRHRLPVVSWQHAAWLKPANQRLLGATRKLSTLWIGDSRLVSDLTHTRLGVPRAHLACWPIFATNPTAPQARAWWPGEPVRLGSLGRLHPVKGYDVLIEALARLGGSVPPFSVEIGGTGDAEVALRALAAARGVQNLQFTGFVEDAPAFHARQHLYVQPSRSEGFCIAAHEAMQAGLPVVASRVGALPDAVSEGSSGILVAPGDPAQLADALGRMLRDPHRLAAMGRVGRAHVIEAFSHKRFVETGAGIVARLQTARR